MLFRLLILVLLGLLSPASAAPAGPDSPALPLASTPQAAFPRPLAHYADAALPLRQRLELRARAEPFNAVASALFLGAILHTFLASGFARWGRHLQAHHRQKLRSLRAACPPGTPEPVSFGATLLHYLGEVEVVFMVWALPLLGAALYFYGWPEVRDFVGVDCDFREPLFVVAIMTISASRPVVRCAEHALALLAQRCGGGSPAAWWLSVLLLAPVLGSLITEPAAMTIAALLLARRFYSQQPGKVLSYATLGLLFVNISVGGVMTNFAAPPVLMVAAKWNWSTSYMLSHFGWRASLAIAGSTLLYFLLFRRQLRALPHRQPPELSPAADPALSHRHREHPIPLPVTLTHLAFLAWTVLTNHYPPLYLGGFLFFLGFLQATDHHQNPLQLRGPLLVGFFLAGLVIHGSCQGWWLEPVLASGLGKTSLLLSAAALTAFNDNALITFLASQVPDLSDSLKYALMAGAVAGGGLTVIANAPNPAGQGILSGYFGGQVSALALLLAALPPTAIVIGCFLIP